MVSHYERPLIDTVYHLYINFKIVMSIHNFFVRNNYNSRIWESNR